MGKHLITIIGTIKRMNAVNNGPRINNAEQVYTGTTGYFRAANVGYSRNHDAGVEVFYRLGQSIENQPLKKYNIYPHSFVFIEE